MGDQPRITCRDLYLILLSYCPLISLKCVKNNVQKAFFRSRKENKRHVRPVLVTIYMLCISQFQLRPAPGADIPGH